MCREISLAMNAVDAGKKTAVRTLCSGRSVIVYPVRKEGDRGGSYMEPG